MTSDYNMANFVSDSQNFTLRLSDGSTIEDTQDLVATSKTKDKDDIIVISDSSCSSSPERNSKLRWKYDSNSIKNKKEKYPRLYFLETSSESESEKSNLPCKWIAKSDDKPLERKYINKTTIQINKAYYTSDETASSDSINDRNTKNKINNDKSYKNPILMFPEKKMIDSKMREKYNVKEANEVITPNYVTCSDDSDITNRVNKFPVYNKLQQDKTGKMKLTKQDTHKILKNIKSTQVVYNSPREKKETNVIIDESTDEDIHVMHPAISPNYVKKIKYNLNDPDVIDTSLKDNVNSQMDLLKSFKTYSKFLDVLRKEDLHKSLSERKKRQIAEWLMTNSPNSLSDSSCSNIPLSIRNSIDSGNSSLERLELDYETPNNRGKINKVQTEKQTTIINSDKVINSFLTHQTITDEYFKNPNNNTSKFNTPDKSLLKVNTDKKVASSVINTPANMDIMNCADILDKLYGNTWRDKANALLPTTEPRKTSNQITNRIIQTER